MIQNEFSTSELAYCACFEFMGNMRIANMFWESNQKPSCWQPRRNFLLKRLTQINPNWTCSLQNLCHDLPPLTHLLAESKYCEKPVQLKCLRASCWTLDLCEASLMSRPSACNHHCCDYGYDLSCPFYCASSHCVRRGLQNTASFSTTRLHSSYIYQPDSGVKQCEK